MVHDEHHQGERQPLALFASPLKEHDAHSSHPDYHTPSSLDLETNKPINDNCDFDHQDTFYSGSQRKSYNTAHIVFNNSDCSLHKDPAFHRHAEATTSELFYDLFFVANLTTFTSVLEINDRESLTAYVGFFSLLWLTWYQVSLYDVRFSTDSVFERIAKAIHFGVMVGFAVIGPQWHPGEAVSSYQIYKAFSLILMVSRLTLFMQYAVTLVYTQKYKKTILPMRIILGSTLVAAILYGGLTAAFPKQKLDEYGYAIEQKSNVYIALYVIALCETLVTVAVSCIYRVISFKGTHMVQRMSLLTLIILGEGIIVICKAISKIVKNEFLWQAQVVGQIVAAVFIIYFLYMLYFDRIQEEHFGSIKQQIWSFVHFPLHVALVLVLQGVSLLIIWVQLMAALITMYASFDVVLTTKYRSGADFANAMNLTAYSNVFWYVPKGVDASKEIKTASMAIGYLTESFDSLKRDAHNGTAAELYQTGLNKLVSATTKALFDGFSVTVPEKKATADEETHPDLLSMTNQYVGVFELVFLYVFIAGGFSLIITTLLGFLSLPASERGSATYVRLGINIIFGVVLCLISLQSASKQRMDRYLESAWMIPTVCLLFFVCVVVNHIRLPKRIKEH